ncbi:MAG: hypothetical protein K0S67_928 [Nitrososphaeraceae archaeon]|jgi:hypothetical protein|nr:hypothetical protein [Nitrososphaeraceae archaeon]MDF2769857.1 hypothetical protein [Nitrososphaeraceae archaeon]
MQSYLLLVQLSPQRPPENLLISDLSLFPEISISLRPMTLVSHSSKASRTACWSFESLLSFILYVNFPSASLSPQ